jgi:hypothetical protein
VIIELFIENPELPLHPSDSLAENIESTKNLLTGLCSCVAKFSLIEISESAAKALVIFHKPAFIELWCKKNIMIAFWNIR